MIGPDVRDEIARVRKENLDADAVAHTLQEFRLIGPAWERGRLRCQPSQTLLGEGSS